MSAALYNIMSHTQSVLSVLLLVLVIMGINEIFALLKVRKENIYSYRIIYYTGALVYIAFCIVLIIVIDVIVNVRTLRFEDLIYYVVSSSEYFIFGLFPLAIILAVFLVISNVVLIKKEGKRLNNFLGVFLGLFLIMMPVIFLITTSIEFSFNHFISFIIDTVLYSLLAYFECILVGTYIGTVLNKRNNVPYDRDYIIILGCAIRDDSTPTPLLQGRLDKALSFAKKQKKHTGKEIVYVCSGGQGIDEVISEADSMYNYLISHNVPKANIIIEDKSTSTYENFKYSIRRIKEYETDNNIAIKRKIAFSTTDYHVYRSGNIAHSLGINAIGIGSRTKWYFYVNALIREFVAAFKSQWVRHVINISAIIVLLILFHFFNFMYINA